MHQQKWLRKEESSWARETTEQEQESESECERRRALYLLDHIYFDRL